MCDKLFVIKLFSLALQAHAMHSNWYLQLLLDHVRASERLFVTCYTRLKCKWINAWWDEFHRYSMIFIYYISHNVLPVHSPCGKTWRWRAHGPYFVCLAR